MLVVSLNGERSDHAIIRLTEEIDAKIEVERIVIQNTRVAAGEFRKIAKANCWWTIECGEDLHPSERRVLLALESTLIDTGDAVALIGKTQLLGSRQSRTWNHLERVFLMSVTS